MVSNYGSEVGLTFFLGQTQVGPRRAILRDGGNLDPPPEGPQKGALLGKDALNCRLDECLAVKLEIRRARAAIVFFTGHDYDLISFLCS